MIEWVSCQWEERPSLFCASSWFVLFRCSAELFRSSEFSCAAVAARILPCLLLFAWRQSSFIINNGAVVSSSFCHDDDSLDENSRHYHEGSWPNKARTINITEHKKCMIMKQDHIHYTINNNIYDGLERMLYRSHDSHDDSRPRSIKSNHNIMILRYNK